MFTKNLFKQAPLGVFLCLFLSACQHETVKPTEAAVSALDLANEELAILESETQLDLNRIPATTQPTTPLLSKPSQVVVPPAPTKREVRTDGGLPTMPRTTTTKPTMPEALLKGEDKVVLDYEQVELRDILQEFADVMGVAMLIDSSIGDKVTMRTPANKPLKKKDLWPLLQLLLRDANIVMEKKGGVYHVKKAPASLPTEIGGLSAGLNNSTEPMVLQITPLRYIALDSGEVSIKPLIEPDGRVIKFAGLNILGIVTTPDKLTRVNRLLNLIDADPFVHRGMRLYRLVNAKAKEVQADLDNILKAVEGNKPSYTILTLERLNAILVVAPPNRGFMQVTQWVDVLDERNESGGEQIFIYPVRNLKAAALASTLSDAFKQDSDKDKPAVRAKEEPKNPPTTPEAKTPETKPEEKPVTTAEGTAVSAELNINIVADEDTNTLVIRATPRDYKQLLGTIALLDRVPKEVMVNVVVAEVTLTDTTKFGIDWSFLVGENNLLATNFGSDGSTLSGRLNRNDANELNITGIPVGFNFGHIAGRLTAALEMVSTDSNVTLLSRPSVLIKNNQEATINVGSDVPTLTSTNTTTTTGTTNQVQYRQTGIILKVKPQINEDGIINMEVSQEISSVGENTGVTESPTFNQRKIETSVVVRDQGVIVLGGLIQTSIDNSQRGIPRLKDVSPIGNLFSNTNKKHVRTELVVIIVPQIIDPEQDNIVYTQGFNRRMSAVEKLLNEEDMPYFENSVRFLPPPTQPANTNVAYDPLPDAEY